MAIHTDRTVPNILTDLLARFTDLLRTESALARVEMSEKVSRMGTGLVLVVIGAVLVMPALVILLQAAVQALQTTGLSPYWSSLVIGGAVFIIGLILLAVGAGRLKAKRLVPDETIHQLRKDAAAAKEQVRRDHGYQRAA
jgi:NADH:ubiquinone oxidoreductase subunit 6 (subunit J)